MSTPQFYSWDDDGSPGRALSGNLQNRLKQILVPCLVTGYGSKPSAGWTLEHEHANGFSLSNGNGIVNFVSNLPPENGNPAMNGFSIHIYNLETVTDRSNAILDGLNLRSGDFSPSSGVTTRHQISADVLFSNSLGTLRWSMVADSETAVLIANVPTAGSTGGETLVLYFGAIDNDFSTFVTLGGCKRPYAAGFPANLQLGSASTSCRSALDNTVLSKPLILPAFYSPSDLTNNNNSLNPSNDLQMPAFSRVGVVSDNKYCGNAKFLYKTLDSYAVNWMACLKQIGLSPNFEDMCKFSSSGGSVLAYSFGPLGGVYAGYII